MNDPTSSAQPATEQAKQVSSQVADRAGLVAGEAGDQARAVAREAKQHATELLHRAKDDVGQQAQQRSGQAAEGLRTLGGQIDALGRGDTEAAGPLVDYLRDAGDRVQRLASRFDEGPDAVLSDIRTFARNRPLVFLGAAGALGFVAGRLVRSGSGNGASPSSTPDHGLPSETGAPLPMGTPDLDPLATPAAGVPLTSVPPDPVIVP